MTKAINSTVALMVALLLVLLNIGATIQAKLPHHANDVVQLSMDASPSEHIPGVGDAVSECASHCVGIGIPRRSDTQVWALAAFEPITAVFPHFPAAPLDRPERPPKASSVDVLATA